jgi:hypothetical protein
VGSVGGVPYHLPGVVDPGSVAIASSTECAKVDCFLAVKVNEKSTLLGEHGRCEPNSQDCTQDKVAQGIAGVNVRQILHKDQDKICVSIFQYRLLILERM